MVRSETMSATTLETILDAFIELPQNVLWKVDGYLLPSLPSNVLVGKWLPQLEILDHVFSKSGKEEEEEGREESTDNKLASSMSIWTSVERSRNGAIKHNQ
uniref:Uncharacterized protein n=1 Tax=Timema poppense TaxID=170557 RepID=A0A7R9DF08_TIMPO|nr:unnamed protein product [Timema poppensis]